MYIKSFVKDCILFVLFYLVQGSQMPYGQIELNCERFLGFLRFSRTIYQLNS